MQRATLLTALTLILGLAQSAVAGEAVPGGAGLISEFKFGALAHDVPGLWSGFQIENPAVDINAEVDFRPFWSSQISSLRPAIGGTFNTQGQTSHAYADLRWQVTMNPSWYLTFGVGAAYQNGQTDLTDLSRKALGARILFHPSLEVGLNLDPHSSVSVYFEHMSNANLANFNEGMDDLGVRYGYRF